MPKVSIIVLILLVFHVDTTLGQDLREEPEELAHWLSSVVFDEEGNVRPIFDQEIHYDTDGLIIHRKGNRLDGGDTSQREGWYWFGIWLRERLGLEPWPYSRRLDFDDVVRLMQPHGDGVFYRHPKLPPWNVPSDKNHGTSRDQLEPMIAALGAWGKTDDLRALWRALPETFLGKHAFNGKYKLVIDLVGEDLEKVCDDDRADDNLGPDCDAIANRDCSPAECTLSEDDRPCDLKTSSRTCELKRDKGNCSRKGTRPGTCYKKVLGQKVPYPCTKSFQYNDPKCEAEKKLQNDIYQADYDQCRLLKEAENEKHRRDKLACEAGKAFQNDIYQREFVRCLAEEEAKRLKCEAEKWAAAALCRARSVHCGDPFLPSTVNLFRRALGENPLVPASTVQLPPVYFGKGDIGENDLIAAAGTRVECAKKSAVSTSDDLNLIVKLLMAQQRFPTAASEAARRYYSTARPHSYGSFFRSYLVEHGNNFDRIRGKMHDGVTDRGWEPDTIPAVGATRWYHRPSEGANPRLADLYQPILEVLLPESFAQEEVGGNDFDNEDCDT